MAAKAEIDIQLNNGKTAGKTMNELTSESVKLNREIKKLEIGSDEWVKKTAEYKQVNGRLKDVKKEVYSTEKAQGLLNSTMAQYIPFSGQIQQFAGAYSKISGGIGAATKAQRLFTAALAASVIGLIVIALGSLVSYLTSTQEGMDKVRKVTTPLFVIFEKLKGIVQELGGSVFKGLAQIMSGDIRDGLNTLKNGFTDLGDSIPNAFSEGIEQGNKLAEMNIKIEKTEIALIKRRAELARAYKEASEIAENVAASDEERRAAAQRAIDVTNERLGLEQNLIDMQIERTELEQSLNDTDREGEKEMQQLLAQRIEFETQASEARTTARSKLNTVNQSIEAANKKQHEAEMKRQEEAQAAEEAAQEKALKAAEEKRKAEEEAAAAAFEKELTDMDERNEIREAKIMEQFYTNQVSEEERDQLLYDAKKKAIEERLAFLTGANQTETAEYQKLYTDLAQLHSEHEAAKTAKTQQEQQARWELEQKGLQVASQVFGGFADLLASDEEARKKNWETIKALKLAEIASNLPVEISNIWKNANTFPPPFNTIVGAAQTALALGRATKQVGDLQKVQYAQGGPVFGPSHAQGGIPFSVKGRPGYEMEGNEIILTKGVYENPVLRSIASDLNAMGGGKSFAMGGPVANPVMGGNSRSQSQNIGLQSGGVDMSESNEYLKEIAINTRKSANTPPPISLQKIRDGLVTLNEVEQGART